MALVKSKLSVPFVRGIDTKTDGKQEEVGSIERLENAVFDSPRQLLKRTGFESVDIKTLEGSSISGAEFLTNYNNELGLFTDDAFHTYSESVNAWTNKGKVFSVYPTSRKILRNDREQSNLDCLYVEGLEVYTYEDSTGVRVSIRDSVNGHMLLSNELISAAGSLPKVSNILNDVFIFFVDGTDIKYRKINTLFPTTIEAEQTVLSDLDGTNKKYDVDGSDLKVVIGYNSSTSGGTLKLLALLEDGTTTSAVTITGESPTDALTVYLDSSKRVVVSYSDGTDAKFLIRTFTLAATVLAATSLETIANVINITPTETSAGNYTVFYQVSAASDKDHLVRKNTIDVAGTTGTASEVKRSVGLASKAFTYDNTAYVIAVHTSTLQNGYFLLDENTDILSKISPNLGGGHITDNGLPKTPAKSSTSFLLASQIKGTNTVEEEEFYSLLGVNSTDLNFELSRPYQNTQLGDNLLISGGILKMYDGLQVVEHGFHVFPEDLSSSSASTGGNISDGQRQYVAVYAWTDNKGNIHRSAPSVAETAVFSAGTATQKATITVPTLRLSQKSDVIIELYGTEAAGTVFYKITSTTSPTYNDSSVDTQDIEVTISDTSLISNEILYTTGGLLDNIAAESSSIIEGFQDRIFLAGLEDANKLQYSKIRFSGAPVEFSDILTIRVDSVGGGITALKKMDDKLVVFKDDACFYLSGDGPNNLGQQDTFIIPQLISSEIGCVDPNSTVLTPDGIMFKSKKGIYLLSRGLGLTYLGSNVEEFNDEEVTSAIVIPDDNQVRFTTRNNNCLVFNYYTQQWATFSNFRALSATIIDSEYYYLRPDGILYKENTSRFDDNGSAVNLLVETSWISLAGVQGFQRVYKMLGLGEYKSPHKLRIRVAYDFKEAFVDEYIINTADFTDDTKYGENSPYGSGSPFGGDGNLYQFRIDFKRQKCQAIKIQIQEIQDSEVGEGLSLSNIAFEVGLKDTLNKLDVGRHYGTN